MGWRDKSISRDFFCLRRRVSSGCFYLCLDWRWHFWCICSLIVLAVPFLTASNTSIISLLVNAVITATVTLLYYRSEISRRKIQKAALLCINHPQVVDLGVWDVNHVLVRLWPVLLTCTIVSVINYSKALLMLVNDSSIFVLTGRQSYIYAVPILVTGGIVWAVFWWFSKRWSRFELPELTSIFESLPDVCRAQIQRAIDTRTHPTWEWRHIVDIPYAFFLKSISVAMFDSVRNRVAIPFNAGFLTWYLSPIYIPLLSLLIAPYFVDIISSYQGCAKTLNESACSKDQVKTSLAQSMIIWAIWSTTYYMHLCKQHLRRKKICQETQAVKIFNLNSREILVNMDIYFEKRGLAMASLFLLAILPIYFDYLGIFV
jgi:hypothetical protein